MIRRSPMKQTDKVQHWLNGNPYGNKHPPSLEGDEFFSSSEGNETLSTTLLEASYATVESESSLTSFSETSTELDDTDSVFVSMNNQDSDVVISKTILGLKVEKVKWNTSNSDLLLRVEDTLLPVHRNLLSAHSDHVRSKLKKRNDDLIFPVRGKLSHVKVILEALYGCDWDVDENNVDDVIKICKHLKIKSLLEKCKNLKKLLFNPPKRKRSGRKNLYKFIKSLKL